MSRIAKAPVALPAGVEVKISDAQITVKGKQGSLDLNLHSSVEVKQEDNVLVFGPRGGDKGAMAMAGILNGNAPNLTCNPSQI